MPALTPIVESTETLTAIVETVETLTSLAEAAETLESLAEFAPVAALPALYPSASATFPSLSGTYPSAGSPGTGLEMTILTEAIETLTPLVEA